MKKIVLFIFVILSGIACTSQHQILDNNFSEKKTQLVAKIDSVFDDQRFSNAFWGVKIISLDEKSTIYERNANKLFMPASNEKIITTSSALRILGPDFRYVSRLEYTGEIKNGILFGDLVVYSNGDPTLYTRFFDTPLHLFNLYSEALKKLGIRRINGNIVGDDSAFEQGHLGYGWSYDGLQSWYSAPYGPLQVNENYIDIKVTPGKIAGDEVALFPNISTSYMPIINNLNTVDSVFKYFDYSKDVCGNDVVFSGEVKAGGRSFEVSPAISDPTLFYTTVLKETFENNGISVQGGVFDIAEYNPGSRKILYIYESPVLSEITKGLMKRSQNLYAETLARTVAWYKTGKGAMSTARELITDDLSMFGLEPGSYRYMDGSGLSRYNYVSPDHLVKILKGMYNSDLKDLWLDIQPLAGVDGTLRRRMKNTSAEGNVRAKTGTISNVRGLSGYVTDKDGKEYAFSFLVNAHLRSSYETELITDKVCELIADFYEAKE